MGVHWVLNSDDDLRPHRDHYAPVPQPEDELLPSAALAPLMDHEKIGEPMTNRRQFIQSGLAVSALSFTELLSMQAAQADQLQNLPALEHFVCDTRFTASRNAALEMRARNVPITEIQGDLTALWYGQYSQQWTKKPMILAGVTASDALFVLETLAADHGMRVLKRSEHQVESDTLIAWVIGPKQLAATFA